ncbi:uncharacterized protein K02A2.6 [Trichonephila clavipes]|nr:uncharacterized protein K02A2.6 [Trichonephila clavipes]
MSGEIAEFVQTCKGCQLRKPEKLEIEPITPIVRPELPAEIVNIDVIGPIQPPSGRGINTFLYEWINIHVGLKQYHLDPLTAHVTLYYKYFRGLEFCGSIIASDQGTNFKLGFNPRIYESGLDLVLGFPVLATRPATD